MTLQLRGVGEGASMSDTGEVEARVKSPIVPQCHSAMEAFSYESASYVVRSPSGPIPISRLKVASDPNLTQTSYPLDPGIPSTSRGQTNFRTKIRTRGIGTRTKPSNEAYPLSMVSRANANRESKQANKESDSTTEEAPQAQASWDRPRGPGGRFCKKSDGKK